MQENAKSSAALNAYVRGLNEFQAKVNASPHGRVPRIECVRPASCSFASSLQIRGSETMGNVWPTWLFEKIKMLPPVLAEVVVYRIVEGVILDESHGCPIGCTKLEKVHTESVERKQELANSETALRSNQVSAIVGHASNQLDRVGINKARELEQDPTACHSLTFPKFAASKRSCGADDASDDFLSDVRVPFNTFVAKPGKFARPAKPDKFGSASRIADIIADKKEPKHGQKANKKSAKQTLQQNSCESLLTELKQVMRMLRNDADFHGVT